jgi:hypothetical protein
MYVIFEYAYIFFSIPVSLFCIGVLALEFVSDEIHCNETEHKL